FGSLFEQMKPTLIAQLRSCSWTRALSMKPDDIEDVLNDVAVNALEHLHTFDPSRGSALTWLWFITRNRGVSVVRRRVPFGLRDDDLGADGLASAELD